MHRAPQQNLSTPENDVVDLPLVTIEDQIHSAVRDLVAPGSRVELVQQFRSTPLPFPAKLVLRTDQHSVT
ncbi:MAG: hypothetical protein ACRDU4_09660, partial [Mycobacterium sp.]